MAEYIAIVNENDEVIGNKDRLLVKSPDIYRVSALWITNSKGQVLIAQRSFNKKNDPGKWGPAVAGTVSNGETYEDNIHREAEEELELKDCIFELGPKIFRDEENRFFCQWFLYNTDRGIEDFKIRNEEVERVEWVNKQELLKDIEDNPDKYTRGARKWRILFGS